jgi:beta-lactamase class C
MRLFVVLFFTICSACIAAEDQSKQWLEQHAVKIELLARKYNLPGYTFIFLEKGKPASIVSYGKTSKTGAKIDSDTVFRLASVSKTFTAALVAKLVEKQELGWSTPLSRMAPNLGFENRSLGKLNLSHLIGQSSGFTPNAYDNLIEANYKLDRVLKMLAELTPLCSPGDCYTYQNALFGVLDHYFAGQKSSYHLQLQQQIIGPLNMPNASSGKEALLNSKNWAKPHIAISRKNWRQGKVRNNYYRFSPAAGVNASIRDMEVWLRALLGEYPEQLSEQLVAQLTQPNVKTIRELTRRSWRQHLTDAHYGLGWRVYNFKGHKLNYHGGWVQGYRADVAFAPGQEVGYAMLMNAESNLINSFTADFWESYFDSLPLTQQVGN